MKTSDGITLVLNLLIQAQRVSTLVMQANAAGRDRLNREERAVIRGERDEAFRRLDELIDAAEAEEG